LNWNSGQYANNQGEKLMAVDDTTEDKTVFRQSTNRGDGTVVRPMPGRRGATQVTTGSQAIPESRTSYTQQRSPAAEARAPNFDLYRGSFKTTFGLNPLVNAASMLIAVYSKTRQSMSHPNPGGLHQQAVREIKAFETRAREQGIKPEIILAARYILCTALDEAVLNTPWGAESAWTQRTLLSLFHNETRGGEKFFQILERMLNSPAENIHILELMYILISLGYEGKYKLVQRGRDNLEQIRDEIFRVIRNYRGEYERSLSSSWHGLGKTRNTLANYVPMWVVASLIGGILLLSYSGFRYWLYESSANVAQQLIEISKENILTDKNHTKARQ